MRIFLIVYFLIFSITDPWVDGLLSAGESQLSECEVRKKLDATVGAVTGVQSLVWGVSSHGHCNDDCPESSTEHACHIGHCGFLVTSHEFIPVISVSFVFIEYNQFIPSPHLWGIKRPPKAAV